MRIVMLTDDVQIDRRILLEAESLISQGHEVILLAAWGEGLAECERLGHVHVERLRQAPRPGRWLSRSAQGQSWLRQGLQRLLPRHQKRLALLGRARRKLVSVSQRGAALCVSLFMRLTSGYSLRLHELAIFRHVRRHRPDVVHAHDLPRLQVAAYAKQRLHVPLVYDAHELYPAIATLSRRQQRALTQLEKRLVPLCDRLITVNQFLADEMAARYGIAPPAVLLNATNRPAGFDPGKPYDRFRACFVIPAEASILLYQGWMSPTRGLQHLVRAMPYLDESIHLVLMGYGETRHELEQIVGTLGLAQRVHFKAAVAQEELLFWTASADAGIIPYPPIDLNNYYCSPNKLFEFIQACVPMVVNDLPFLRQIVGGEGFGVVAKLDTIEAYVAAIQRMFDPQLGGPGRFLARLQAGAITYSWEAEAKKLLAVYEGLMPQSSLVA